MEKQEFPKLYNWEILPGLPGTGDIYQFHRPNQSSHSQGLVIKVVPDLGSSWVGNFQKGGIKFSGVYACPAATLVCVIAGGEGYLVYVDYPTKYEVVDAYPITEVCPITGHGLVVFVTYTELVAYGIEGRRWKTERLSRDGIRITNIAEGVIQGIGWDPSLGGEVEFTVYLQSGHHEGGIRPDPQN